MTNQHAFSYSGSGGGDGRGRARGTGGGGEGGEGGPERPQEEGPGGPRQGLFVSSTALHGKPVRNPESESRFCFYLCNADTRILPLEEILF